MNNIKTINQGEFAGMVGNYGIINQGTGYAVVNILTKNMEAHNISSYLDAYKTAEYLDNKHNVTEIYPTDITPPPPSIDNTKEKRKSSNILDGLDIYDQQIKGKIENIKNHSDKKSKFYGKLVNWHSDGFWHYGIGLSDDYIFDLGENLDVFHKGNREIKLVKIDRHFSPDKTIKRLAHALCCFKDWHYGFLGWNCEHYSRLVATNVAICYQVKDSLLAFLNHGGYHPTAVQDLTDYLNNLGLFELTRFEN